MVTRFSANTTQSHVTCQLTTALPDLVYEAISERNVSEWKHKKGEIRIGLKKKPFRSNEKKTGIISGTREVFKKAKNYKG